MKKRLVAVVVVLVLTAGGIAAYMVFWRGSRQVGGRVSVSGNIEITDAEVSFQIPGKVEARLVSEGELVRAGQTVARLDARELMREVALRKAEVDGARARLNELEAGYRREEIAKANAVLARNRAEEERFRAEYLRKVNLVKRGAVSEQDYDTAKANYEVAKASTDQAEAELERLKTGPRKEEIARAKAELEQARERLELARTRLDYATLVSPLTGVVLSENVEPGEYVSAGTPVVTAGDLVNVWLRGYINETDLGRVKVGQSAHVTSDTYPGKRYEGTVSFIASEAEFTPKRVQTQEQRVKLVYRIKVDVKNPDMELKAGMPAEAVILTGDESE